MNDNGCYLTLSQCVGNVIKFYLGDDGKKHTGKIIKIFVTMSGGDDTEVEYEVKTKFRGKTDYTRIKSEDVIR